MRSDGDGMQSNQRCAMNRSVGTRTLVRRRLKSVLAKEEKLCEIVFEDLVL
jgi:hypothetical protein